MDKTKTLKKRSKYLENLASKNLNKVKGLKRSNTLKELTDENEVSLAIFDCLLNNDPNGAVEIIQIYLNALNLSKISKGEKLPRSTIYSAFKHRNPTIKTLAKIMHATSK